MTRGRRRLDRRAGPGALALALGLAGLLLGASASAAPARGASAPVARPAPAVRPTPAARPAPGPPRVPLLLLPLKGYRTGVYVPPSRAHPRRQPVLVLLHGNYDRRASECQAWGGAGPRWGWLLCPAGLPREDAPKDEDRFTYGTVARLLGEIRAGLDALERLAPGRLQRKGLTLVGFSLGALLAPEVAFYSKGLFTSLVLVEGVRRFRRPLAAQFSRRGIRRVAFLCGEKTTCQRQARQRSWYLRWAGVATRTFVMPGVGHDYPRRFAAQATRVLRWTRGRPPGAQGRAGSRRGASGGGAGAGAGARNRAVKRAR